jgi:hypothetical protein
MSLQNLSIEEFKSEFKVDSIDIVRSPITQKLFAVAGGENYRAQGKDAKSGAELDVTKTVSYMWDTERQDDGKTPIQSGCFVNGSGENLVKTL